MAEIVVVGAGVCGLGTAMLLAKDGHRVTVLERDPAPPPPPDDAWERWERRGVNQFRQLHFFQAGYRAVVERELPEVLDAFLAAGAIRYSFIETLPPAFTGGVRPGDDEYVAITARRPVAEAALASVAEATPGVVIRRGVAIAGLLSVSARGGVPHVSGVVTEDGDQLRADLVVDASGRRSPLPSWLADIGARPAVEEAEDSGFVYFGRHFRTADGSQPPMLGPPLQNFGAISTLTLPADNGVQAIGVIAGARDTAARALASPEVWNAVVRSVPTVAHWLDGEPLDDRPQVMAKIEDRYRRFCPDEVPVATGVLAVGDAWACTNPSLGRGMSIGMLHAVALRDTLREVGVDDPYKTAVAFDQATESRVTPWYRTTLAYDRNRLAEVDAAIDGVEHRPDDDMWDLLHALAAAAPTEPDLLRRLIEILSVLRLPEDVFSEPGMVDAVRAAGGHWREIPSFGPSRSELLALFERR